MDLTTRLLMGMEDDPRFNAGYGAALQADGKPRLSAALMDGRYQRFSGVISVSDVRYPSRLALALQTHSSRVLTAPGHQTLARRLNEPVEDLVTSHRLEAWLSKRRETFFDADTVGALLCNRQGELFAGTSTGGRGFEEPGRVSDSATVAGNYASLHAAISATGIGEQIVDAAVAARIETRVRDGLSLDGACRKTFEEAQDLQHNYGWIACDRQGHWCVAYTSQAMSYVVMDMTGKLLAASET